MTRMRLDDVLMLALAERLMETGHVLGAAFVAGGRGVCLVLPEEGEMTRKARLAWAVAVMLVVVLAGTRRPAQAFLGLDPASWIVVGQMASVVSQMVAVRDSMMRLRDEALSHARGLIEPVDDFAGELRSALKGGDWSAFNAGDVPHPEDTEIGACPGGTLPPRRGRRRNECASRTTCPS